MFSLAIGNYRFISCDRYYLFMLLVIPIILNISIDSSFLNICSSLLQQLLKIIQRANVLSKIYDILGFLNFLYLLHLIQYIFFSSLPFSILFIKKIFSFELSKIFQYHFIILFMFFRRK